MRAAIRAADRDGKPRIVSKHFPALDGLRGIAVIAVFVYHYGVGATSTNPFLHAIGLLAGVGWAGVTLFFLLSGFLITGILWDSFGEKHWWRNFYVRRALRIFPLYYGSLVLILLAAIPRGELRSTLHLIWIPALFLENIPYFLNLEHGIHSLIIFHYWSLAVEEQFYLVWPLLLFGMKTRRQAANLCLTVCALSLLFRIALCIWVPNHGPYNGLLPVRAGELALGGWLALTYRSDSWHKIRRFLPLVAWTSGAAIVAVGWSERSFQIAGATQLIAGLQAMTFLLAALLMAALEPGIVQRAFSAGWLRWVGKISFGIYVFHVLLMRQFGWIAAHIVPGGSHSMIALVRWPVAAVCTVAAAWLSYTFFEAWFLGAKDRLAPRTVPVARVGR